ncbi:MAG TPA: PQQ-binding-like beta-propeller repeat protein [Rhodanobacteraceae bacterium]
MDPRLHARSGPHRLARIAVAFVACVALAGGAAAAAAPPPTPDAWTMYALTPGHNAYYASDFPAVSWHFTVPGASQARGNALLDPTVVRDLVGFGVGVALVAGTVYADNNDGWLYALAARTGKLRWRFHAFNQLMGTPVVATVDGRRMVFVGAGNSVFAYSEAVKFGVGNARVTRGNGVSALYALDAATGRKVWAFPTRGEDMPTPVLVDGRVLFGNGDGHVYALDAATGKLAWKTDIRSFVSMSSATLDRNAGVVVMGGTHPSRIYGLDAATGKLLWSVAPPGVFSSSAGDGTWASAGGRVIGQIETQDAAGAKAGTSASEELAIDVRSGRIVWSTQLGSGKTPPRNKDAVPTVVDGVVYTGSPVTHVEYALDAVTGKVLWQRRLDASMKAAPTVVGDSLVQPTASGAIVTLDRRTGAVTHTLNLREGGYGPQNAIVVGRTLVIGSNAGVLQALPLRQLGVEP